MALDAAHAQPSADAPTHTVEAIGARWAVAAGHPLAAAAAARLLQAGGNAIDAGVAGGLCLGVVHPDMVSFAGVAPVLVHLARTRETWQVSGVGPYPRAITLEYFRDRHRGEIPPGVPRTVVPAAPAAWLTALARWGTMSFADVVAPALECAERGFPISRFTAHQMAGQEATYRQWPTSAALFLREGRPLRAGEILVQSELAQTIRAMTRAEAAAGGGRVAGVRAARDAFYRGDPARAIAAFHRANGGLLAYDDLASFDVEVAPALRTTFHAYEVAACGFWCQGPVLLQMLNLLEGDDLRGLGHNSPAYLHRLVETIKLAFADREAYYGDPRYVKVPAEGLLSKAYALARRALIREGAAWPTMPPAGDPDATAPVRAGVRPDGPTPASVPPAHSRDTSYVAVVDAGGNAFSATPSDFTFRGGALLMPFGTPGGDVQQQAMLQVFLNVAVFGLSIQDAIEAPRVASRSFPDSFWPHPIAPGKLEVEGRIPAATRAALAALGHEVSTWPDWEWRAGGVCGVLVDRTGARRAGVDPRRGCHAIAW